MKACIYGAGSLGTVLGAYITKNGGEIDLINRNKAHVAALNEKGEKGEEASVTFIPQSTAKAVTITLDGNVIRLYNIDTDATNYLVINDVNMGVVNGDTVDLTAYKTLSEGVVSIRILSVKEGSFPSYSNTINVELQVQNDND